MLRRPIVHAENACATRADRRISTKHISSPTRLPAAGRNNPTRAVSNCQQMRRVVLPDEPAVRAAIAGLLGDVRERVQLPPLPVVFNGERGHARGVLPARREGREFARRLCLPPPLTLTLSSRQRRASSATRAGRGDKHRSPSSPRPHLLCSRSGRRGKCSGAPLARRTTVECDSTSSRQPAARIRTRAPAYLPGSA